MDEVLKRIEEKREEEKKKRLKEDHLIALRMMEVTFQRGETGTCKKFNSKVKADNEICSFGDVRRLREWGSHGTFCADCPYFVPDVKRRICRESSD